MAFSTFDWVLLALAFTLGCIWWRRSSTTKMRSQGYPLPPGPKRKPLIGNLLDIPLQRAWYTFTEWRVRFGDIIYVEALGNGILILNTIETVNDLLEKRANVYSDRPTFVMVGEMMELDKSLPMLPCGSRFRQQRKLCHSALSQDAVKQYHTLQEDAVASYINSLFEKPRDFRSQLRLATSRIIMAVTYGIPVSMSDHTYIEEAEATMDLIGKATVPGAFLVDLVPILKYLPSWLPFNSIPRTAEIGRNLISSMVSRPYHYVKQEMTAGNAHPSFTSQCLQTYLSKGEVVNSETEDTIRWAAGAMYGAGGESTYASILTFIYAMSLYPEVQRKIKDEIDSVIGGRLPSIQDRPHLPYVCAAIKEVMRWRPALPLSIARKTNQDDYYRGYFIPKGTIVLPNVWVIADDEKSGIPSEEFSPERFLDHRQVKASPTDPYTYSFGFGRRACPGEYLGENNLFLFISYLMATVDISQKRDASGNYIPLAPSYTAGLVSFPEPFEVDFTARHREVVSLIKDRIEGIF